MDLKLENIPSFVLHTFHLIYLSHDSYTYFMDLKLENISSSTLHLYIRTVVNFLCYILYDTNTLFGDLKFENISSLVLHTFHFIYLALDSSKCSGLRYSSTYLMDLKFENILSFFHLIHLA